MKRKINQKQLEQMILEEIQILQQEGWFGDMGKKMKSLGGRALGAVKGGGEVVKDIGAAMGAAAQEMGAAAAKVAGLNKSNYKIMLDAAIAAGADKKHVQDFWRNQAQKIVGDNLRLAEREIEKAYDNSSLPSDANVRHTILGAVINYSVLNAHNVNMGKWSKPPEDPDIFESKNRGKKITALYLKKVIREEIMKISEGKGQRYDVPGHGTWFYRGDDHGVEVYEQGGHGGPQVRVSMMTPGGSVEERIAHVLDIAAGQERQAADRAAEKAKYKAADDAARAERRAKEDAEVLAATEEDRKAIERGEPMQHDEDWGGGGKMMAGSVIAHIAGDQAKWTGWEKQPAKRKVKALKAQMKNYSSPDDIAEFKAKIKELGGGGFFSRFGLGESQVTTSYLEKAIKEEIRRLKK